MKTLVLAFFLSLSFYQFAQTDSTIVAQDTLEVYVINNTNRLIKVGEKAYVFEFRDLKSIKEIHTLNFKNASEVEKFIATCFRSLEQGVNVVGDSYSVGRNKLSKNVIRVDDKADGHFLMTYDTLEKMQIAFNRSRE